MSTNGISLLVWTVLVAMMPLSHGTVDCPTACRRCREGVGHRAVLEVYCAMCQECRARRQQLESRGDYEDRPQAIGADYMEECPTPPPCESDYDEVRVPLKQITMLTTTSTTTTTTTTTTRTTTRRPCPPAPDCKRKRKPHPPQPCCMPMCAFPTYCPGMARPQILTANTVIPFSPPAQTSTTSDFFYVHVGVPRQLFFGRI